MVKDGFTCKSSFYARPNVLNEFRARLGANKTKFYDLMGIEHNTAKKLCEGGMTYRYVAEKVAKNLGVDPAVIFIDYAPKYVPDQAAIEERNAIILSFLNEIKWTSMKYGKNLMKIRGGLYDIDDVISCGYLYALESIDQALFRAKCGENMRFVPFACGAARRGLSLEDRKWRTGTRNGNTISYEWFIDKEDTVASSFSLEDTILDKISFFDLLGTLEESDFENPDVIEVLESLGVCV